MAVHFNVSAGRPGQKPPKIKIDRIRGRGWVIRVPPEEDGSSASLSIGQTMGLYQKAKKAGLGWIDTIIPHMLRCAEHDLPPKPGGRVWSVLTRNHEEGVAWRAELAAAIPADLPPLQRWLRGPDYGLSSGNLAWILSRGETAPGESATDVVGRLPCDAEEFARCLSLLDAVPDLRGELDRLADEMEWGPIIALWPALEKAYRDGETKRVDVALEALAETRRVRPEVEIRDGKGDTITFPAALVRLALPYATDDEIIRACAAANLGGGDATYRVKR